MSAYSSATTSREQMMKMREDYKDYIEWKDAQGAEVNRRN
jgi:hypothetical protein